MNRWKAMLSCLEQITEYAHASLGHLGVEKCTNQIGEPLHIKILGRKPRKFIACYDLCQRAKTPCSVEYYRRKTPSPDKTGCLICY
jgi:hypothetical protein